jgi:hypothetical protein
MLMGCFKGEYEIYSMILIILLIIIGFIINLICNRYKIHKIPVFLISGLIINHFFSYISIHISRDILSYFIYPFFYMLFPIIIFDIFSRIKLKNFDTLQQHAFQNSAILFLFTVFFVGIITYISLDYFFPYNNINNILLSIITGIIFTASTNHDYTIKKISKAKEIFLYHESILTCALTLFFFSIMMMIIKQKSIVEGVISSILGIGIGFISGLILFRYLNIRWKEKMNHWILMIVVILIYLFSEIMSAEPILTIIAFSFFFGNITIKTNEHFQEFPKELFKLMLLSFIFLIPFYITLHITLEIIILSLGLIIAIYISRYFSLRIANIHDFNLKERIFISLYSPKGTIILILLIYMSLFIFSSIQLHYYFYSIYIMVIIISLFLSSLVERYSKEILR